MYASVIVDIVHSEVDKIFDYSVPPEMEGAIAPGCRVTVPFGPKTLSGYVTALKDETEVATEKIKPVRSLYDELPALTEECLDLAKRISERYRVPMAAALRLFLPSEMRRDKVKIATIKYVRATGAEVEIRAGAEKQREALDYLLAKEKPTEYKALCSMFGASAVAALQRKGAVEVYEEAVARAPRRDYAVAVPGELTNEQKRAIAEIESSDKTVTLLHGVTGSGKTEIYIKLIEKELEKGRTAIFLVPEISLTPQMMARLRAHFGDRVAVLHSSLTAGERYDEWRRLRRGEAKIAVGPRSAVFAPLQNVGVIVIDEEHDDSYQSETSPRYKTADIAKMRAERSGAKIVLGSATPSVETYTEAAEGRYNLVTLSERINRRPMPDILVADMRRERARGNDSFFSALLRDELKETLDGGNQAMIFMNRRGYAQNALCRECGYVARCEDCDVALVYHREDECLMCHCCGKRYKPLYACPECGSVSIRYRGVGTERVVGELQQLFPEARILRMDRDSVSGKDGSFEILKKFSDREADILVGTQMIAKGHDFPSVTLVGIVDADMSLHFSDYRANERTFQLITQVAGRSGRADEKGKVVLQTFCPDNAVIRYAKNYDYLGFFESERRMRKATNYPPYAKVVRIMAVGEDKEKTVEACKSVFEETKKLREKEGDEFIFLNRMKSPVNRMQDRYRYQVLARVRGDGLLGEIYDIAASFSSRDVSVYVEENPASLI